MRLATTLCLALLAVGAASAQQRTEATLEQRYGTQYQEVLDKYGRDPQRLQKAEQDARRERVPALRLTQIGMDSPYVARAEAEPNNFFDTADDINDVLAMEGNRAGTFGRLLQAAFTAGDIDVYRFTVDTTMMYFFSSTHSFLSNGSDGLEVNARLFHASDLDTTTVLNFNGITGNEKRRGDLIGRPTDGRNGSNDFRLTGWVPPVDPTTGRKLTGDFYLWVYNREGREGTYYLTLYALPLEPLASKFEPNQTNLEVLDNGLVSVLPTDAVVRSYLLYNPDTLKIVTPDVPTQGNNVYPQLWARGDEDADYFLVNYKAGHTLVVETLPFFGYYRDNNGDLGPGGTRMEDTYLILWDADRTTILAESDDDGRESMDGPNNIHARLVITPEFLATKGITGDTPLWIWAHNWASQNREPGRNVDNSDPGRAAYNLYATMYETTYTEVEPNETIAEATSIAPVLNTAYTATFASASDVDYYRAYLNQARMYSLLSLNSTVTSDLQVELYREYEDVDGTVVLSDNLLAGQAVAGALGSNDFRVAGFIPPASGAYLIKLTSASAGSYQFALFESTIYEARVFNEPDNTSAEALARPLIPVGVGSPRQNGMIFPAGDVDHYVFGGVAGQQVTLKLQSLAWELINADFAAELRLLSESLDVLAIGTDSGDAFSALTFTLPATGTYIIQVQAAAGTTNGFGNPNVGFYSLNVGDPVREIEPNNTPESASVLLNGFIASTIPTGDVDWYRIPVQQDHIYHIRSLNNDFGSNAKVDLFRASDPNTSIHDGSDWNGRYGSRNFKVQLLPTEDGEYLLKIDPPDAPNGGNYEIHIKSNDISTLKETFEPNDTFADADAAGSFAPDGTVLSSMLYNPDTPAPAFAYDQDVYRVDIDAPGKKLVCETLPFDGANWGRDSDMFLQLFDATGTLLTSNDDSPVTLEDGTVLDDWHSRVEYDVAAPGTFYCVVGSQDFLDTTPPNHTDRDPTTAEYKLRISYTADEVEPNNDFTAAMTLAPGGAVNAAFSGSSDVDVYQLDLKAGNIYHIRTFRSDGMDSFSSTADLFKAPDTSTGITDSQTGGWRTRNNDSNLKLNLIPTQDETYYLRIAAPANLGSGTYQVLVKSNPLDPLKDAGEPNNTFDQADALPVLTGDGTVQPYMLYDAAQPDFHDDLDYYRVQLNADDKLTVETLPFDGPLWPRDTDMYLFLYGPARQELADNDDNAVLLEDGTVFDDWHSKIEYTATETGTHYVLVLSQDTQIPPLDPGESRWRDPARAEYKLRVTVQGSVAAEDEGVPETYELAQNYPNPFNPATTIQYALPLAGKVRLAVYNLLGQQVATLVDGPQAAGRYTVPFDASHLASGVYFYRLEATNFVDVKKMLLVK